MAFGGPAALQFAAKLGDLPSDLVKFQAAQKGVRCARLGGSDSGVHFRDVDRTARQEIAALEKRIEEVSAVPFTVHGVHDHGCVQEIDGHYRRPRRF